MRTCFCGRNVFGTDKETGIGYCSFHQHLRLDLKKKRLAKIANSKKKNEPISEKEEEELQDKKELELWFQDRSKEMVGVCAECGSATTKGSKKYWKYSICHILPKSIFKSVRTHPFNFIELCYFYNSHHSNLDNMGYEIAKKKMPKAWNIIVGRVAIMWNQISHSEKGKIPDVLRIDVEGYLSNKK